MKQDQSLSTFNALPLNCSFKLSLKALEGSRVTIDDFRLDLQRTTGQRFSTKLKKGTGERSLKSWS